MGRAPGDIAFLGSPKGSGIDAFRVNMADGSLQPVSSTGPEVADLNSDGMCTSADGRFLYCVNRTTALDGVPGTGGSVDSFAIDPQNGSLRHLNRQASWGAMPVSVRIDKTNSRVVVANHGAVFRVTRVTVKNGAPVIDRPTDDGTFALFPVGQDGSLGSVETGGSGHREFNIDPSGRYLFNCSLGSNDVITFSVDPNTGKLTRTARVAVPRAAVIDFAWL